MAETLHLVAGLQWPAAARRPSKQSCGTFKSGGKLLTLAQSVARLEAELARWKATGGEINADFLATRSQKVSLANIPKDADQACILKFYVGTTLYVMPMATFDTLPQNIGGLEAHLGNLRAIERYGVQSAEDMMGAFVALPAPTSDPWAILGIQPKSGLDHANGRYRDLVKVHHPDSGGSQEMLERLAWAINEIREGRA